MLAISCNIIKMFAFEINYMLVKGFYSMLWNKGIYLLKLQKKERNYVQRLWWLSVFSLKIMLELQKSTEYVMWFILKLFVFLKSIWVIIVIGRR